MTKTLPLNLLLKNRRILMVGAGQVGARKARTLLDFGCSLQVVAPEMSKAFRALLSSGRVTWKKARFSAQDLRHQDIVFAATDEARVNREIAGLCREHRILCGVVDTGWQAGDFISPALFTHRELVVAISTGGVSCRRSRLAKEYLAQNRRWLDRLDLLVMSLPKASPTRLQPLRQIRGLHEFVLVNAGPHLELYAIASHRKELIDLLSALLGSRELPRAQRFVKWGPAALEHTVEGQAARRGRSIARALKTALTAGWAGSFIQGWLRETNPQNLKATYERILHGIQGRPADRQRRGGSGR